MINSSLSIEDTYQAPSAELLDASKLASNAPFVVSTRKLITLQIFTLGLYSIYWFYKNYKNIKASSGEKIWPVPRSIFQVFYTHDLFKRIHTTAKTKGIEVSWSHHMLALAFILLSVFINISDRISVSMGYIGFMMIPLTAFIMAQVQVSSNGIANDSMGDSNSKFTWANYLWCVLGAIVWFGVAVDAADTYGLISLY